MKNSDFENKINDKFNKHLPPVDNDAIWQNIEPHLDKKKDKRFFIWFFFGVGGLLIAIYFFKSNSIEEKMVTTENLETEDYRIKDDKIQSTELKEANSEILNDNVEHSLYEENKSKPQDETSSGREIKSNVFSTPSSGKTESGPPFEVLKFEKISILKEIKSSSSQKSGSKDYKKTEAGAEPSAREKSIVSTEKEVRAENQNLAKKEEDRKNEEEMFESKEELIKKQADLSDTKQSDEKISLERTSAKDANKILKEKRNKKKKSLIKKDEKEAVKKIHKNVNRNRWNYYAKGTISPILSLHNVRSNSIANSDGYFDRRKEMVKTLESFGIDFNIQAIHKQGLILSAGLQFQQMNQRIKNNSVEIQEEIRTVVTGIVENLQGETVNTISEDRLVSKEIIKTQLLYNQFRVINLPIGIGYEFKNRKTKYKVIAGFDLNLFYKFRGSYLNSDLSIRDLDENTFRYNQIYKRNTGLNFWTNFAINKSINKRLNFVASPGIQMPLGRLTKVDHFTHEKWYRFKLDLGVNYLLNPKKKKKK